MKHSSSEEGGETVMEGGAAASGGAAAWWRRRHGAPVPLDSECKARQLRLLRPCAAPHMRSFYLAMLSHFVAVFGKRCRSAGWEGELWGASHVASAVFATPAGLCCPCQLA